MDEQKETEKELPEGYDVMLESGQPEDDGMPSPETETELGAPEPKISSEDTTESAKLTDEAEPEKMLSQFTPAVQAPTGQKNIKKYFLYVFIGGLVASSLISIVAVLIGEFNDFIQKSLTTTLLMVAHALAVLAFISVNDDNRNKASDIVLDTLFGVTIASFITSIFAVWEILTGSIIGHLYIMYFYAVIAALLIRALLNANRIDKVTRMLADVSIYITIFLFALLMPSVFVEYPVELPETYNRGLAATAILLGTTTILTVIFHRLYVNKHPEIGQGKDKPFSVGQWILIAIVLLFAVPVFFGIIGSLMYTMR